MYILHVIDTLGVGGAERLLVTSLPKLRCQGHNVCVVVMRPPFDMRSELLNAGIEVIVLPIAHKYNIVKTAKSIARVANERQCSIIHAHLYFPAVSTALGRLLGMTKAATAVTFHNLAYAPGANKPGLGLKIRKLVASILYPRGFDAFLGISSAVASHYEDELDLSNIEVLHNPVDLDAIDSMGLIPHGDVDGPIHIVLPGRLVHEKGHLDLIEAVDILHEGNHEFRVTLAGDGPMRSSIVEVIEQKGLSEFVTVTGVLPHARMLETIAGADIVVVPSRFEGFGLTAIEAMALYKPVVATRVGGLTDIIVNGETGLLVQAQNPEELAKALQSLMQDASLRSRFGQMGRKRVEQYFSLHAITDQLLEIYARIDRKH